MSLLICHYYFTMFQIVFLGGFPSLLNIGILIYHYMQRFIYEFSLLIFRTFEILVIKFAFFFKKKTKKNQNACLVFSIVL